MATFSPTPLLHTPAAGQPMTVDEFREKFSDTMGTVTPDSGFEYPNRQARMDAGQKA